MMQEARMAAPSRKKETPAKPAGHASASAVFQHYQSAVQLVQQAKYDKALAAFEKVLEETPPAEIRERCTMYIQTCQRQMEKPKLVFATASERYDYAISQLNAGFFEEAREQLNGVLTEDPRA